VGWDRMVVLWDSLGGVVREWRREGGENGAFGKDDFSVKSRFCRKLFYETGKSQKIFLFGNFRRGIYSGRQLCAIFWGVSEGLRPVGMGVWGK